MASFSTLLLDKAFFLQVNASIKLIVLNPVKYVHYKLHSFTIYCLVSIYTITCIEPNISPSAVNQLIQEVHHVLVKSGFQLGMEIKAIYFALVLLYYTQ